MRSRGDLPNNQHTSKGVLSDLGAHKLEGEINIRGLLILDPFVQIARGENDVVHKPLALREIRLEPRLVQVLFTGFEDEFLIILDTGGLLVMLMNNMQILTPSRACAAARGGTRRHGSCAPKMLYV